MGGVATVSLVSGGAVGGDAAANFIGCGLAFGAAGLILTIAGLIISNR